MKKLAILICSILLTTNVYSQENKFSLGVKAGINLSNIDIEHSDFDAKIGYNFGVVAEYALAKNFFLQSGLNLSSKGAKMKIHLEGDINENGVFGDYSDTKMTCNSVYLQLPILAGYKVDVTDNFKINFVAGPYLACGVGGKVSGKTWGYIDGENFFDKGKESTFSEEGFKRFDLGLLGGVGAEYHSFTFNLGYEFGLSDLSRGNNSFRNRSAYLTVGYKIF